MHRKKWPKKYIKKIFESKDKVSKKYSDIILNDVNLLKGKDEYLPGTLYKFYTPTADNILDIKNKRIWMCNPNSFNDPFDCRIGYDHSTYEKQYLVDFIKSIGCVDEDGKNAGFTNEELGRIIQSSTTLKFLKYYPDIEDYDDVIRKVLKEKSVDFQRMVSKFTSETLEELDLKINEIRKVGIRVACFSKFEKYEEFYKKIQMWSHYADNHKGFCVEYDVSSLRSETTLSLGNREYYNENGKEGYLKERIRAVTKGGVFPVDYTSDRVNIPASKLKKVKFDISGDIDYQSDIDEIIYKSFIVKSTNWSYENEWRVILDGNICSYYDNKIPFPYIKRIYLGCKMDNKTVDTLLEIGEELGIEVVMMRMDNKKFTMESSNIQYYKWDKEKSKWANPYNI